MTGGGGPWHDPPPPDAPSRLRRILVAVAIVAGIAGLLFLFRAFPGQSLSEWDWMWLLRLLVILAIVAAGAFALPRTSLRGAGRNIAIWVAAVAVLALAYSYRDEIGGALRRVEANLLPASAVATGPNEMTLTEADDGNYYVFGTVNGTQVKFAIDTGASDIVLSPSDARRAGIDMNALAFTRHYQTANGTVEGAPVAIAVLEVGAIRLTGVPASVNRAEMGVSLLGMSFLRRLDGFEMRGGRMILHWR